MYPYRYVFQNGIEYEIIDTLHMVAQIHITQADDNKYIEYLGNKFRAELGFKVMEFLSKNFDKVYGVQFVGPYVIDRPPYPDTEIVSVQQDVNILLPSERRAYIARS